MKLELGDCLEVLKTIPDNSVDSIVTDPPYGISFMSKKWDYDVPSVEIWTECLRVLKPGGHLLSFSGSRTYHRMAVRIEDAGFEIRDQIMWIYGSGFPKSHNIGKAVDKLLGNEREVVATETTPFKVKGKDDDGFTWDNKTFCSKTDENGYRINEITKGQSEWEGWGTALKPAHEPIVVARKPLSEKSVAENVLKWGTGGMNIDVSRIGLTSQKDLDDYRFNMDGNLRTSKKDGEKLGMYDGGWKVEKEQKELPEGRFPANIILDEEAGQILDEQSGITQYNNKRKEGNYKGGHRKEYVGTDDNPIVNKVDGKFFSDKGGASRFFYCPKTSKKDRDEGLDGFKDKLSEISQINSETKLQPMGKDSDDLKRTHIDEPNELGRWPANIILDEEAGELLDEQSGISKTTPNHNYKHSNTETDSNTFTSRGTYIPREDKGGASRFFYCPKTSKKDRDEGLDEFEEKQIYTEENGKFGYGNKDGDNFGDRIENVKRRNNHPTVKPTSLMEYLIKLVTPVGGTVLDPFMGSGSTGKGAVRNGFDFIGIEREEEYLKIARARIENELKD